MLWVLRSFRYTNAEIMNKLEGVYESLLKRVTERRNSCVGPFDAPLSRSEMPGRSDAPSSVLHQYLDALGDGLSGFGAQNGIVVVADGVGDDGEGEGGHAGGAGHGFGGGGEAVGS